jgi:CheY-like chemotaxis protein
LESVDVGPLVASAVAVVHETAILKGLQVDVRLGDDLPRAMVDPLRTKQILINLLSNSAKFTEPGGEIVVSSGISSGLLSISVADTGIGIPVDRIESVFAPFEQIDSSLARSHEGTGLGLALSRRFAEAQGGSLTATSELGHGSVFTFTLPLAVDGASLALEDTSGPAPTPRAAAATGGTGRVLVVEDNEVNRLMVTDYLEAHGLSVAIAIDGDDAIVKAKDLLPDVILMDIQLPGTDGLAATRILKADPATQSIPVIAVTALAMKGDAETCLDAGCDGYLSKPCDPADILAAVEAALAA